jgi:translation initiation factor 1
VEEKSEYCRYEISPTQEQTVYLHRVHRSRGAKQVALVQNLALSSEDLKALAKKLKRECGIAGAIKDCIIEAQGE